MIYRISFTLICAGVLVAGVTFSSEAVLSNIANLRINTANALAALAVADWKDDISGGECSGSKTDSENCSNKYITKYVFPGIPAKVISCKIHPKVVQQYCIGETQQQCQALIDSLVYTLTEEEGNARVDSICTDGNNYGYRGALACFEAVVAHSGTVQQASVISAVSGRWDCCKEESMKCSNQLSTVQSIQAASLTFNDSKSGSITVDSPKPSSSGGPVVGADAGFSETMGVVVGSSQPIPNTKVVSNSGTVTSDQSDLITLAKVGAVQVSSQPAITNTERFIRAETVIANSQPVVAWSSGVHTPNTVETVGVVLPTSDRQTETTNATQSSSQGLIDAFVGTGGLLSRFTDFVTGSQVPPRTTPPGTVGGFPTTQVIYVTPEFEAPKFDAQPAKNLQEIAREVSATVSQTLTRTEQFAATLSRVGGPNEISMENKAYGRIQDLIIEDEAVRSLEVAQREAERAKNSVFCDVEEQSESCKARREARAKEVERQVFIHELTQRELPESAITHFLAVYDGWIDPSPAPATYATSTLSLVNAQQLLTTTAAVVSAYVRDVVTTVTETVKGVTNTFRGILSDDTVSIFNVENIQMLALTAVSQGNDISLRQSATELFGPSAFLDYITCSPPQNREVIVRAYGDGPYLQSQSATVLQGENISADCSVDAYGAVTFTWSTPETARQSKTCTLFRGPSNSGPIEVCPTASIVNGNLDEPLELICWHEVDSICGAYEAGYIDKGELTEKAYADMVEAIEEAGVDIRSLGKPGAADKEIYENFLKQGGEQMVGNLAVVFDDTSLQTDMDGLPIYVPSEVTLNGESIWDIAESEERSRTLLQEVTSDNTAVATEYAPTFPSKSTGYRVDPTFSQYEPQDFSRAAVRSDTSYIENRSSPKGSSLTRFASGGNTTFTSSGAYTQSSSGGFISRTFAGVKDTFSDIGDALADLFSF